MTADPEVRDRLDRLESLVEDQQETIECQRERIAELEGDGGADGGVGEGERDGGAADGAPAVGDPGDGGTVDRDTADDAGRPAVTRRTALKAGGLLGLLGYGTGQVAADPQGQVGTGEDPVRTVHTEALAGGLTGDSTVDTLAGEGLSISGGALTADGTSGDRSLTVSSPVGDRLSGVSELVFSRNLLIEGDGDGTVTVEATDSNTDTDTHTDVSDGETTVEDVDDVTFGSGLDLTDDSDGTATVDASGIAAWADGDTDDLLAPTDGAITGIEGTSTVQSPSGSGLIFDTDGGTRALRLAAPTERDPMAALDVVWREGANVVAGEANNAVTGGASGVVIGGGGEYLVGPDADQVETDTRDRANTASADYATLAGGRANEVSGAFASLGGGERNEASGKQATVGGGSVNTASGKQATVGGGSVNTASTEGAAVGGGTRNEASEQDATVGGGIRNEASSDNATVGGGSDNTASRDNATVGGGGANVAKAEDATVGGGSFNEASGKQATVGGGDGNVASEERATVGGGDDNEASGQDATVGGGSDNQASGQDATIGGGSNNAVSGQNATVPGGFVNAATGKRSLAAGGRAAAEDERSFVWNDGTAFHGIPSPATSQDGFKGLSSSTAVDGEPVTGSDTFTASATDGFRFVTGGASSSYVTYITRGGDFVVPGRLTVGDFPAKAGADLGFTPGGQLVDTSSSSARYKTDIRPLDVDTGPVLDLDPKAFEYERDGSRGVGFVAEEADATFPEIVRYDDQDRPDGIDYKRLAVYLLPEIRANRDRLDEVDDLETETDALREENDCLRERNEELEARLDRVEAELEIEAPTRGVADD
jgi:hypothetical protein